MRRQKFILTAKNNGLLGCFILLFIIFSVTSDSFLTVENVMTVFRQATVTGVLACAVTLLLIAGQFDLSVGSMLSLSCVLIVKFNESMGIGPAVILTLLIAAGCGLINGFLVGILKLNSFITTLGSLSALSAISYILANGQYIRVNAQPGSFFDTLGNGYVGAVPVPVIIFAIVAVCSGIFLSLTIWGRRLYAIGGNATASKYSGIPTGKMILGCYVFTAVAAALGAIITVSRVGGAEPDFGSNYEFEVLAAIILGGSSILGGSGNIQKTVIGVLLFGFIYNGLVMWGAYYYTQWVVQWIVIIAAVIMDIYVKKSPGRMVS